ncbi:glycosyltransferase family protein [Haoranjiania flava]|uniref:Glycosyl transferase n=1 Tax=Haoranjiania flava TaxID=1856322 RepID=A0AAE3LQ23_9BACT|nr:glycosyltransferase family protein [Haoranjiania flava]MCU7694095.1 glycosyl transferase [Haoranjiania flava]
MRIFYAVQATGNGHISRAMELLPYLEKFGTVDFFLSGNNSTLKLDAHVPYRSKGLSFQYTSNGGLHYPKTFKEIISTSIWKEARHLPIDKYDMVINDFEPVTSLACKMRRIKSVHFGHQASFKSYRTPRPRNRNLLGELILTNYVSATTNVGLHFQPYDDFILPPVIKTQIWQALPRDFGHISVYLPSYDDKTLIGIFTNFKDHRFEIFSREVKDEQTNGNITLLPVSKQLFNNSLINCHGIITSGGFETPAEALYLKKKLLVIPIKGQYEQLCNAAALARMGYSVLQNLKPDNLSIVQRWLENEKVHSLKTYNKPTAEIVEQFMEIAITKMRETETIKAANTYLPIT